MKTTLLQRSRSCFLTLAALLSVVSSALHADDHGNNSATATLVTLPATVNGEIEITGDTDWFKFTLTAPTLVTATSSGTTDVQASLYLGGARGAVTLIYGDNDGAGAPNFKLSQLLPAGTHYICVGALNSTILGSYTVDFQTAPPPATQPDIALGVGGVNLAAGTLLDFGTLDLGTQATKDIVIGNVGDAGLRIYSVRSLQIGTLPTGAAYPWRTLASPSLNIAAGNQTMLRLGFQPTVAGTYNTKYTIVSNDGDEILYEFTVRGVATGNVAAPELAVRDGATELASEDTVAFGATMAGTNITKDLIIANTGVGELRITAVTFTSTTATGTSNTPIGFTTVGGNIFPNTVPGGGQATVSIRFGSLTPGDYNAKITMTNNDANESPMVINLTGTITPDLTRGEIDVALAGANVPNNTTVPFGNTFTATPVSKDFVITNSGTAPMPITWSMQIPFFTATDVFITSTTVVGSPLVTVTEPSKVVIGMKIPGVFPASATVTSVSGNTVTFSAPAIVAVTNQSIAFRPPLPVMVLAYQATGVPQSLAAGASATVRVTFNPQQTGDFLGELRLNTNDLDENPFSIKFSGHADVNPNPPDIAVALNGANVVPDADIDFGAIPVSGSGSKTFTITNTGTGDLRFTGFPITPVLPSATTGAPLYFYFGGIPQNILAPGASGNLTVIFKPSTVGTAYKSSVNIGSTDPDENPYKINFLGTGAANPTPEPEIEINVNGSLVTTNGNFAFGSVNSGTLAQKSLLVRNVGTAPLTISGLSVGLPIGSPAGTLNPFAVIGTTPFTVNANSTFSTWLNFAPTIAGDYTGVVQLANNDADENPYTINVTGTGVGTVLAPEIDLAVAGAGLPINGSVDYGATTSGSLVSKQFTINNTGTAALTLSGWAFQLPSGSTISAPTTTTIGSAVATVANTNGLVPGMTIAGPFPVGTGIVSITGNSVTFSSPALSNVTNSYQVYYKVGVPILNQFKFDGSTPTSVPVGGSATFTVTYAPLVAGTHSMIVRFMTNDLNENPYQFTVNGSSTGVAPAPEIGIAVAGIDAPIGSTLAYGNTTPGLTVTKTLAISNTGDAPLTLSGWSFINPAPAITTNGPSTVGSTSITVTSATGISAGMVVAGPFPAGTSVASVAANVVTFSAAATATSTSAYLTFYPAGTTTVNPFGFVGALPSTVLPGATATVTVRYAPTAAGNHTMNLRFTNNDTNENPFQLTLTGSASGTPVAPEIGVSLAGANVPLNGSVAYGSTNTGVVVSKQFTIANTGTATLNLSSWSLTGPTSPTPFYFSGSLPTFVAVGGTATFTVNYLPTAVANHTATVRFNTNDGDENPYQFTLTGSGTVSTVGPDIDVKVNGLATVSSGSFAFGSVNGGTVSQRSVLITNTGSQPLTITGYSAGLAASSTATNNPFGITGLTPPTIAPLSSYTLWLIFAPTQSGNYNGVLQLTSNDPDESPYTINLTGTGLSTVIAPEFALSLGGNDVPPASTVAFGATTSGSLVSKVLSITNSGDAPLTVYSPSIFTAPGTTLTTVVNTTLGSAVATVPSTSSLVIGMTVSSLFPVGTSIVSISGTSVTFSAPALSTSSGSSITFFQPGVSAMSQFRIDGTSPAGSIAPGTTRTFTVTFAPTVAGNHKMVLSVGNSDITESSYQVYVTGSATGVAPGPEIGASVGGVNAPLGSTVDMGSGPTGTALEKQIVFSNTGTTALNLSNWSLINPAPTVVAFGSTAANSNTAIVTTTSGISAGMVVTGGPFTAGTTLVSLVGTTATFSAPANYASTSSAITFYPAGTVITSPYSYVGTLPTSIAAGSSATVTVRYLSNQPGTQSMSLRVTTNDADENPFQLTLSGTSTGPVLAPEIGVAQSGSNVAINDTVAYGSIGVGATLSKQFTVTNTGTAMLTLGSIILVPNAPNSAFSTTTTFGSSIATVANGSGLAPGMVIVSSSFPANTTVVSITGNLVTFSANATIGGTSLISYYPPFTSLSTAFRVDGYTSSIAPGGNGVITLTYVPTAVGSHSSLVRFFTNDSDENPYQFALTGSAAVIAAAPEIDVRINSVSTANNGTFAFGSVNSGVANNKTLAIYNTGTAPLTVSAMSVNTAAGSANPFGLSGTIATVPAGGSASVTLSFAPNIAGDYTGVLSISSNDGDEGTTLINLTGTAVGTVNSPEINVALTGNDLPQFSTVDFGATTSGSLVTKEFTITNSGNATLNLTSWQLLPPSGSSVGISTSTTMGSAIATVPSTNSIVVGMTVAGLFPTGTSVVAVNGSSVTFSAPALSTANASILSYYQPGVTIASQFRFDGLLPPSLAAGASATIMVTYAPLVPGTHSSVVRINSNDISEPAYQFTVNGSSTGFAPTPEIGVALAGNDVPMTSIVDYGTTLTGVINSKQYTVTNTGDAPLSLSGWTFITPTPAVTTTTGNLTQNSNTSTVSNASALSVGLVVSSFGLPVNTTITAISGTTVTFSAPATSTTSITSMTFYPAGTNLVNPFSFNGTLPNTVAVGGSATFTVNYFSNIVGSHSWNVRVNNNDANENPFQFNVTGNVVLNPAAPDIAVFNGTTELPTNSVVELGTTARGVPITKDITIKNLGGTNLTISHSSTALLPQPLPTTAAITVSSFSTTTGPAGTSTFRISFNPSALSTSYSTRITISSNDPDESPYVLVFNGSSNANESEINVAYAGADLPHLGTIGFGNATLGTTVTRSYTVTNTGTASLFINSLTFNPATGSFPAGTIAPFYVSGFPGVVLPGATGTVNIVYRPVLASTADAWTVTMSNNDADEAAYRINLTGSADVSVTPGEINIAVDGTDIASGGTLTVSTPFNTTLTKDVIITNTGTGPLILGQASLSNLTPTGQSAFATVTSPGSNVVVPAGGSATWRVRFLATSTAATTFTGKLTLYNTDSDESAYIINLTGTVVP